VLTLEYTRSSQDQIGWESLERGGILSRLDASRTAKIYRSDVRKFTFTRAIEHRRASFSRFQALLQFSAHQAASHILAIDHSVVEATMHAFNEHLPHPVVLPAASRDTFNIREVDLQTCENHHVA
jgi:hypothetical protein